MRAADSGRFDFARSSVARVKELFFLLTKTYIEVGKPSKEGQLYCLMSLSEPANCQFADSGVTLFA